MKKIKGERSEPWFLLDDMEIDDMKKKCFFLIFLIVMKKKVKFFRVRASFFFEDYMRFVVRMNRRLKKTIVI